MDFLMYNKSMKKIILISLISLINLPIQAKHLHSEREYQTYWCTVRKGQMEYRLKDRERVDCLLPNYAVEIDFAPKWHECIGQALDYAVQTRRNPMCALIIENPEKDLKYIKRLRSRIQYSLKKKYPNWVFGTATITSAQLEKYYIENNIEIKKD